MKLNNKMFEPIKAKDVKASLQESIGSGKVDPKTMWWGIFGKFQGVGVIKKYKEEAESNSTAALYVGVRYLDKHINVNERKGVVADEYSKLASDYLCKAYVNSEEDNFAAFPLYLLMVSFKKRDYDAGRKIYELLSSDEYGERASTYVVLGDCARIGLYTEKSEENALKFYQKANESNPIGYIKAVADERAASLERKTVSEATEGEVEPFLQLNKGVKSYLDLFLIMTHKNIMEAEDFLCLVSGLQANGEGVTYYFARLARRADNIMREIALIRLKNLGKCFPSAQFEYIEGNYFTKGEERELNESDHETAYLGMQELYELYSHDKALMFADELCALKKVKKSGVVKTAGILKRNKQLAETNAHAAHIAGMCYLNGVGTAKNEEQAKNYFLLAVKHGDYHGFSSYVDLAIESDLSYLDRLFEEVDGDLKYHFCSVAGAALANSENKALAFKYFEMGALGGDIDSISYLAVCYLNGSGVERNAVAGVEWLEKGAAAGDGFCMYVLADCLQDGEGVEQPDLKRAMHLYQKAADEGVAEASLELFYMYRDGIACTANSKLALEYLRAASQGGSAEALYETACCYETGDMLRQDAHSAAAICLMAAKRGNKNAQYKMSKFYYDGFGVPQNYGESARWLRAAESLKDPPPHNPSIRKLF